MPDIIVRKGKWRTTIIGVSLSGKLWLEAHYVVEYLDEECFMTIMNDYHDDFIKDLQEAQLEIDTGS